MFYSDDSDIPSSYKGELSNGVEFWFEPYENSSESVTYKVDCADGTNAYLEYSSSLSEITFTADKGTEYGNMFAYSGTYIGLPDVVEEQTILCGDTEIVMFIRISFCFQCLQKIYNLTIVH